MKLRIVPLFGIYFVGLFFGCGGSSHELALPAPPAPEGNRMNYARIKLGEKLFFDPRLSGSNWISCATCHNPALGWSDGLPTGLGHAMQPLGRNTPTIINAAYNTAQFWDGRVETLEAQALGPIEASGEMNQNPGELVAELKAIEGYPPLFESAYPDLGLSPAAIAAALAVFERTIISGDSPFDRWRRGAEAAVSQSAVRGFDLFQGKAKCQACHSGPNFSDGGFHNIGVRDQGEFDPGRFRVTPVKINQGGFKTPGLRDAARTGPYMHNGSYRTLREVVDHYDRGGDVKWNLDPEMKPLGLTEQEKEDIVEFLLSLTGDSIPVTIPELPQ